MTTMKKILIAALPFVAALTLAPAAHAVCFQDCYQNGDTYQCTENCY